MTSFATADDLANRLGLTLTAAEQTRADALLADASGLIQDAADQTISQVTDDVLTRPGTTDDRILLPERPVTAVSSVTLDGAALVEGTDWYLDGNTIIRIPSTVTDLLGSATLQGSRGFGLPWQTLAITYTHGYADADVPKLCKQIALEAVVRVWTNPGAVIQEGIGPEQVTYAPYAEPPEGLLLTRAEERRIRRKFGRRAASVQVDGGP